MLDADYPTVEALRAHLQRILRPEAPPPPLMGDRAYIPRLD
ncbi:MAG TPA: hypothetical protein VGF48_10390 [Thermoanaerobaculia bacterium]|jgi:hypothetical protein